MIKTINTLFVTMFGLGKIPKIPGTFGSLATVIILYLFFHIFNLSSNLIFIFLIIVFILSFSAVAHHIKNNENKEEGHSQSHPKHASNARDGACCEICNA